MIEAIGFNRLIRYCFNSFSSIVVSKLLICNVTHCFESNGELPFELAFRMLPLKLLEVVWPLLELEVQIPQGQMLDFTLALQTPIQNLIKKKNVFPLIKCIKKNS